ncbi:hypothetical protein [Actinotignum schaalii]|nr:hypothetical protein [Actinotignum schaalii]WQN45080.1 hypothetical protein U4A90_08870 [Actinotignum schaalii]
MAGADSASGFCAGAVATAPAPWPARPRCQMARGPALRRRT